MGDKSTDGKMGIPSVEGSSVGISVTGLGRIVVGDNEGVGKAVRTEVGVKVSDGTREPGLG